MSPRSWSAFFAVAALATSALAQPPSTRTPPPRTQTSTPAYDDRDTPSPHGLAEAIEAANRLLDRAAKPVTVEVTLAEVVLAKPDAPMPDLTGPDVLRRLDALVTDGHAVTRRGFAVTAVEGKPATVQDGASQPYVTGENNSGRGQAQRSISYRDVGTTIKILARQATEGVIRVDLDLADGGVKSSDVADGQPTYPNFKLATTVGIPAGKAAVAYSKHAQTKAGRTVTLVIVAARVSDPAAKTVAFERLP